MITKSSFPKSMIFFHISGILLIFLAYIAIYMMDLFLEGSIINNSLIQIHFLVGFLVLMFLIPRLIIHIRKRKDIPSIVPDLSKTNKFFLHAGHIAIYLWTILIVLSGWAFVSTASGSVGIFGIHIPGIIAVNKDSVGFFHETHEIFGTLGLFLIIGHIAISLFHHFKIKDNALVRMFPCFKQR